MKKYTVDIHTSKVHDGNMSVRFGDAALVQKNRDAFLLKCGVVESHLAILSVSHGDVVRDVSLQTFGAFVGAREIAVDAEAVVTKDAGITLFLLTADCIPVVFFDRVQGVVALAHLGWRPTVLGLAPKTIRHMEATYGAQVSDLEIFLGPSIHAASYVFPEVTQNSPDWTLYLEKDTDSLVHVNLPGYVKSQCVHLGVPEDQVHLSAVDTAADIEYFSHANTKKTSAVEGRFATIATLGYADLA